MAEARGSSEGAGPTAICFLSHGSRDAKRARELRAILEDAGMTCWMAPDDIPPGADWPAEIVAAIERSTHLIVLLSRTSVRSDHVSREVAYASERGIQVVPLRLTDVRTEGTLRYMLQVVHRVDVFPGRIADHRDSILAAVGSGQGPVPHEGPRPTHARAAPASVPPGAARATGLPARGPLVALAAAASGLAVVALALVLLRPTNPSGSPPPASGPQDRARPGPAIARVAWVRVNEADERVIMLGDVDAQGHLIEEAVPIGGYSPALAPDGNLLAYRNHDGDIILREMGQGRTVERLLVNDLVIPWPWSVAPSREVDGRRSLIFTAGNEVDGDMQNLLVTARLDPLGGGRATAEDPCLAIHVDGERRDEWAPSWSPDGERVAFGRQSREIHVAPAGCGLGAELVYSLVEPSVSEPTWWGHGLVVAVGDSHCVDTHLEFIALAAGPAPSGEWLGSHGDQGAWACHPSTAGSSAAEALVYLERIRDERGSYRVRFAVPAGPAATVVSELLPLDASLDDDFRPSIALLAR